MEACTYSGTSDRCHYRKLDASDESRRIGTLLPND